MGSVFLAALDAVVVVDAAGLVCDWNPSAEELFGYSRADAIGRPVADLIIPPPVRDAHRRGLRRHMETGERRMIGRRHELSAVRADGTELAVEMALTRLEESDPPLFAAFIRELPDRTESERDSMRLAQRMSFLAEVGLVLDASLDYQETLRRLVGLTVPDLAHLTVIDLLDDRGGAIQMAVAAARDPAQARAVETVRATTRLALSSGHPVGIVLRTGEPMLLPTMSDEFLGGIAQSSEHLQLMRRVGYRSSMTVPLVARGRALGTLSMIRMEDGVPYGEEDFVLANELARRAALAVDNARLFESTRHLARTLQQSLLPHELPEIPGMRIAARYRAAERGHDVGGDFYDIFATGPEAWAFTIGDVCGKGAEAAALTALARYTIRAFAARSPGVVLRRLNQAVIRERDVIQGRFLTALFAVGAVTDGTLRLEVAAGGHPAPLVLRRDGTVEPVAVLGPLIGMDPAAEFRPARVELADGDRIVLYTDGLTDARAPERILSEADLATMLSDARGLGIEALIAHLEERATGGSHVRDDIALLVVEVGSDASGASRSRGDAAPG